MRTTASGLAALAAAVALTTLAPAALQAQSPAWKAPEAPSDVAAPPADAVKTASGLATKVLQPGTGDAHPTLADKVTVHYAGWTTDGRSFDSSYGGKPVTFALRRMIAGWKEGLQLMVPGEKRRLWVPQELAYGGRPGKPAGMLVFDIELVSIEASPKAPPDLVEPPGDAKKTGSTG